MPHIGPSRRWFRTAQSGGDLAIRDLVAAGLSEGVDGAKVPYFVQSVWAGIATLNGLPATTMPIARTENGLPIGMQIIGGFLDDRTTIAVAGLIEREFGGFTPPPGF